MRSHNRDIWCGEAVHYKNDELKAANAAAAQAQQQQAQVAQQQLAQQQAQLQKYNDFVTQLTANGGYSPGVAQALNSQAINQVPQQFAQSAQNLKTALMTRGGGGGDQPTGGEFMRQFGGLESAQNALKANLLQNVTIGGQNNISNAMQGTLGIGAQYGQNVGSFNYGSNQALGTQASSANNISKAQNGLLGSLIGAGAGLGMSAITKCWIARAVYGDADWRAELIRSTWDTVWAEESTLYRMLWSLYGYIGQPIASILRRNRWAKRQFRTAFDKLLWKAMNG